MVHERYWLWPRSPACWRAPFIVAIGFLLAGCAPGGLNAPDQTAVAVANAATATARASVSLPAGRETPSPAAIPVSTPTSVSTAAPTPLTGTTTPSPAAPAGRQATQPSPATPTVAVATPATAGTGRKYTDPEQRFSVVVPDGWQRQQTQVADIAVQFVSDRLRGDVNIVVEDAPNVTLDQYVAGTIANIKRTYPELKLTTNGVQVATLGGEAAQQYQFSGVAREAPIQLTQLVAVYGDMAYVITFTVASDDSAAFTDQMNRMIRTFAFLDRGS